MILSLDWYDRYMDKNRLGALENQCIQECAPPCTALCPVHVDIRRMTSAVGEGDFAGGYKILQKSIPFPGIIARTCDQPCQQKCYRETVGGVIQVAALERACVEYGLISPISVTLLPKKNAHVAVIGGGLSGLTAAFDLSKKGYQVDLFEMGERLGGRLWELPENQLPRQLITNEIAALSHMGVTIHLGIQINAKCDLPGNVDAIYLGTGNQGNAGLELALTQNGSPLVDPDTFQSSQPDLFAGGSLLHTYSTITSVSDGRRAAISIDRFLQNVSLTASRNNEDAYETDLVTNISKVTAIEIITPGDFGGGYSKGEAQVEAKRCIQCDCMECVKVCEYLKHYGSYPKKYVREIYNNLSLIMRTRTSNKLINSCTLCGLCAEVCPSDLDMGVVNKEARQTMVKTGKMPISAHDFALRDMDFSNSDRFAATLTPDGSSACTHLFFPGCQLAASNPEYIPQIYKTLSIVFPDLGVMLRCCGAPADWSGELELYSNAMEEFKQQWQAMGSPRLILACSSCNRMIKQYIHTVETISIWEVFDQHRLLPGPLTTSKEFVIHDPCTSRYESTWQDAARAGLTTMGVPFHELEMSRNLTECCGYGGAAWLAHPEMVKAMVQRRIGEDQADYLTYCVMCRDLFAAQGKSTLHLLDLIYGKDIEMLGKRKGPDYSQRHENRIRVKQRMVQLLAGKDQIQVKSYEKYLLILSNEMLALIESRLILIEDIQKVIEHAETSQERFIDQESGHTLAYFRPNLITYWVEYTPEGKGYQIHDAYSHRMEFGGDASV
jgi:glutamate synthase (NADPH/NADH) small chain